MVVTRTFTLWVRRSRTTLSRRPMASQEIDPPHRTPHRYRNGDNTRTQMKLRMLMILAAALALSCLTLNAQTPSGLLTGPVTYTSPLNNSPYGNPVWTFADGSKCGPSPLPACPYIIKYVVGLPYSALQASDGTCNCYAWDVWQLSMGACQSSFHGGAPGEYGALYCGNTVSSDINGRYTLSCTASFDGTAIAVQGGIDVPIPTLYTVNVTIKHHPVQVWIGPIFRTRRHLEKWQVIDSAVVTVIPNSI